MPLFSVLCVMSLCLCRQACGSKHRRSIGFRAVRAVLPKFGEPSTDRGDSLVSTEEIEQQLCQSHDMNEMCMDLCLHVFDALEE